MFGLSLSERTKYLFVAAASRLAGNCNPFWQLPAWPTVRVHTDDIIERRNIEFIASSVLCNVQGEGRAVAQAVSRRLPTAAVRVRAQVKSRGICGGQSGMRQLCSEYSYFFCQLSFHRLLHTHQLIIWGWYNRPNSGRRTPHQETNIQSKTVRIETVGWLKNRLYDSVKQQLHTPQIQPTHTSRRQRNVSVKSVLKWRLRKKQILRKNISVSNRTVKEDYVAGNFHRY
jgi:hypothetical protein